MSPGSRGLFLFIFRFVPQRPSLCGEAPVLGTGPQNAILLQLPFQPPPGKARRKPEAWGQFVLVTGHAGWASGPLLSLGSLTAALGSVSACALCLGKLRHRVGSSSSRVAWAAWLCCRHHLWPNHAGAPEAFVLLLCKFGHIHSRPVSSARLGSPSGKAHAVLQPSLQSQDSRLRQGDHTSQSQSKSTLTFFERTDAETPILRPPDVKSQLIGKDSDAGKDERQRMTW